MGKADNVIRWFMPKEERFHDLLDRDTQNLLRATRLFSEIAHTTDFEERRAKVGQLKAAEHEGDGITQQIFEALNSTFITPLDREDIRQLATDLDDILDFLEGVAQNLILFELKDSPPPMRRFAELLVFMVEEIHHATSMVWNMANEKRIHTSIVRISELENQADALYASVIADLFKSDSRNPVEIMKWKEVYQGLEDACDECRDYTHALGNVVVKNA